MRTIRTSLQLAALAASSLIVTGCPSPSKDGGHNQVANVEHSAFTFMTDDRNYEQIDLGHGQKLRVGTASSGKSIRKTLVDLITEKLEKGERFTLLVEETTEGTPGTLEFWEVSGAGFANVVVHPFPISSRPSVAVDGDEVRIVPGKVRLDLLHFQVTGLGGTKFAKPEDIAPLYITAIGNPDVLSGSMESASNKFIGPVASSDKIDRLAVSAFSYPFLIVGGPCTTPNCVVCVTAPGKAKVTNADGSKNVDYQSTIMTLKVY